MCTTQTLHSILVPCMTWFIHVCTAASNKNQNKFRCIQSSTHFRCSFLQYSTDRASYLSFFCFWRSTFSCNYTLASKLFEKRMTTHNFSNLGGVLRVWKSPRSDSQGLLLLESCWCYNLLWVGRKAFLNQHPLWCFFFEAGHPWSGEPVMQITTIARKYLGLMAFRVDSAKKKKLERVARLALATSIKIQKDAY